MSLTITYEQNGAARVRSSFVAGKEAILLASARAGDLVAFESLVMPHRDVLLRVAWRILRNREDAEDAVQTAFLDAFRNLNGFQGRSRFSSWLTRIAMNAALMLLRVNRREPKTSLDEMAETDPGRARFHPVETRPNPEQEYMSNEGLDLLEKGLKKLKPLYVEVLRLRSLQELSDKEAAEILEVPVGTVKARLHRARVQLIRYSRLMLKHERSPIARRQCFDIEGVSKSFSARRAMTSDRRYRPVDEHPVETNASAKPWSDWSSSEPLVPCGR